MIKFILQKLFPQTIDEIVSEEIQLRDADSEIEKYLTKK